MKKSTRYLVLASLLAALTCVATIIIKVPSPFKGYLNLGDSAVLLSGFLLPSGYGFLAAAVGSALADLFAGYGVYAPATFFIKGLTALVFYLLNRHLPKTIPAFLNRIIAGVAAETVMVTGYFIFEGIIYGFSASAVNIPANAVQGIAGIIIGMSLMKIFEKLKIRF